MAPIRVVVADDYPIVRDGIKSLLGQAVDIQVIGEASTGEETLRIAKEMAPDVLLLDLEFPGMKGIDVVRQLRQTGASVKIIVLSAYSNPECIKALIEIGIEGYLLKEEAPEMIIGAVRGVARGEQGWVSRRVPAGTFSSRRFGGTKKIGLTRRELEILGLVVEGKTNQSIAVTLGIKEKTVEKHLNVIFQKMDVASRTEAAVYAVREELVKTG